MLPLGGTILLIGKRRSGKSTMILNILRHFSDQFEFGFVMCGSASTRKGYANHIPEKFILDDIDISILDNLMKYQDKRVQDGTAKAVFIVIDDCAFDQRVLRSKTMTKLFFNGRHYKIFFILGMQYPKLIGPDARSNIDVCFLHRDINQSNHPKLYDYTAGFKTLEDFRGLFEDITLGYRIMVIQKDQEMHDEFPVYNFRAEYPIGEFTMNRGGVWWDEGGYSRISADIFGYSGLDCPSRNGEAGTRCNQSSGARDPPLLISKPATRKQLRSLGRRYIVEAPPDTRPVSVSSSSSGNRKFQPASHHHDNSIRAAEIEQRLREIQRLQSTPASSLQRDAFKKKQNAEYTESAVGMIDGHPHTCYGGGTLQTRFRTELQPSQQRQQHMRNQDISLTNRRIRNVERQSDHHKINVIDRRGKYHNRRSPNGVIQTNSISKYRGVGSSIKAMLGLV